MTAYRAQNSNRVNFIGIYIQVNHGSYTAHCMQVIDVRLPAHRDPLTFCPVISAAGRLSEQYPSGPGGSLERMIRYFPPC